MANEIQTDFDSEGSFTITLASLANGAGRSSAKITNSNDRPAAIISFVIRSGSTAPTADKTYKIYLLRDTGSVADDNWGGSDAAFTPLNAPLLGTIKVTANTNTDFAKTFDTSRLGPLGPEWGIAVYNDSGQALNSTEGNHDKHYRYYVPEIQ